MNPDNYDPVHCELCREPIRFGAGVCDDDGNFYCDLECYEDEIVNRQINNEPMPWEDEEPHGLPDGPEDDWRKER